MRRENTLRIDFSCFPVKPSFEKVHSFCRQVLGLKKEDVQRLQCHRGEQCAFVKVSDLALAQQIVNEHDAQHEVEIARKKNKLRITMEDGSVDVKIHDLPESVSEAKIIEFLSAFGEVLSLQELTWGENYEFGGVPLGIWSARMILRQNIDSWVSIDGQQAYVVYKGQLLSCKHCKELAHSGISCVQNKKLLVQKSYANVAKQAAPRRPQHKPDGVKATTSKPVGQRPTVPSSVPLVASSVAFPELSKSVNQNEPSGTTAQTDHQPRRIERTASPIPQNERSHSSSSIGTQPTNAALVDLFKKPAVVTRSQNKSGNGTETDESSTSTTSRRNRNRKKPRRDDEDDEQDGDYIL